jgi:hypothetical protein
METPSAFVVEIGTSWKRWAKRRTDAELEEINSRLRELVEGFSRPHIHAGLGIRRLSDRIFEFRGSRDLRVVFVFIKPRTIRLAMCGSHNDVREWLREND